MRFRGGRFFCKGFDKVCLGIERSKVGLITATLGKLLTPCAASGSRNVREIDFRYILFTVD